MERCWKVRVVEKSGMPSFRCAVLVDIPLIDVHHVGRGRKSQDRAASPHVPIPVVKYPGPFFGRNSQLQLERLHNKYGPIVRITPYIIDVDIPEIIQTVFSTKGNWLKTPWYHGSSALVNNQIVLNLFSQTNPKQHAKERKPIAKFYSPSATAALEPHIDSVIKKFCQDLERRFINVPDDKREFDLGQWILFYTWDVTGAVTFSKPFGYLDKGFDFDGVLHAADKAQDYFVVIGAMPFLDRVFDKNPVYRVGPPGFNTSTGISIQRLQDRYTGADKEYHNPDIPDFLDRFIAAKNDDPENVSDPQIISWLMVNMIAGSDTTAITIRSALYFSLSNPKVWSRLNDEIRSKRFRERGMVPPAYKEVRAIPYVDAVVREALRILPGVSMSMERYVPAGGFTLPNGDYLPGGTIIGVSPYITNRNQSVFGVGADAFRPERWLRDEAGGETEESFQSRLTLMNKADLSFGGGSRSCIGKNLGLFQSYKVLATLITLYDIELSEKADWKVICSWFPRQEGLRVRMRRRP
ncbi:hypothetical protein VDGL01_00425 [Verticillium dahliae]